MPEIWETTHEVLEKRITRLLEEVRRCADGTVIELAEVLLRWCREGLAELKAALDGPNSFEGMAQATAEVSRRFDQKSTREFLDDEDISFFSLVLASTAQKTRSTVLAARAVAEGLDEGFGYRFALCFRGRCYQVQPDKAFPVNPEGVSQLFGDSGLTTEPDHRGKEWDALNHLRLAPRDLRGYQVVLDWRHEDQLSFLRPGFRVGVGIPNATPSRELKWRRYTRGDKKLFFDVRPADEQQQKHLLLSLLERADQDQLDLLILPELCQGPECLEDVRTWFRQKARHLKLLAAGSHHIRQGEGTNELRRNECVVFLQGGRELSHLKFNPFSFNDLNDEETEPLVERAEDIHVEPVTLTLHMSGARSCAFLICKDLLHNDTLRLLGDFRASFVFVPALSPKGGVFNDSAGMLNLVAQSVVLVANAVDGDKAHLQEPLAVLARPVRRAPMLTVRRGDARPPTLLAVDLTVPDACWKLGNLIAR